ncbi:MAG TPA: hypothetical protein VKQ28_15175 [Candidatus Acidoferrum sp.]|nr:hypothetical protein [Candidatus Acidoferrum sp.]
MELRNTLNLIFRRQTLAGFLLIRGRFPVHIENLIARTQNCLRITVTVEAPLHQQGRGLKNQGHLIDLPVASGTAHTFVDVDAVIEIDVVRQAMNTNPLDGFISTITFANWLQVTGVVEKDGMAIHAGFGGGNAGGGGSFHAGVTVTAIDSVVSHMVLVTELDGLLASYVLVGQIRSASQTHDGPQRQGRQQSTKKDTELGDKIRTAVKNLGHVNFALLR